MAYSFTSPVVVKALINAKKRGVDVRVVIDEKGNSCEKCKASKAAMNLLVNADIPLRTVSKYKIMHDKVIITDGANVETTTTGTERPGKRHREGTYRRYPNRRRERPS
ncbi:phospholipase D-like domain-containing protein [Salmonella enterica]